MASDGFLPTNLEACYGRRAAIKLHPSAAVTLPIMGHDSTATALVVIVGQDGYGLWVMPLEGPMAGRQVGGVDWHIMVPWGAILYVAVTGDPSVTPPDPTWRGLISAGERASQLGQRATAAEPSSNVGMTEEQ